MRTILISLAGLLFAYWGSTAIYNYSIVPNLESVTSVPILWWIGMYSPILLVAFIAGYKIKEMKALLLLALVGAFVYLINDYIKASTNFHGYFKSNLIEGDAVSFVINFSIFAVLLFGALLIGSFGAKVVHGKSANQHFHSTQKDARVK